MLNIPTDIKPENVKEVLLQQNRELAINNGNIETKFCYITKGGTGNLVIEIDPGKRKKLIQTRVKLGWAICKVDDYVIAKKCYCCGRYNHTYKECKGEETCPLCTGNNKLKERSATKLE